MIKPEEHAAHDAAAEQKILDDVARYGFHAGYVPGDGYSPGFAYTIGLFKTYGYPELVCFGLHKDLLHSVLWSGKELLDENPQPDLMGSYSNFIGDFDVRLLLVDKAWYQDYFGYGYWFNGSWDFPVVQIVWPDKQALFPWKEDFNPDWKWGQPLLDRNTNFKFREERNVAVFTTRQVFEGLPILRVVHDTNGDWEFLCDTTYDTTDLKVVALEETVKLDPSINELFQLNYGWQAWRAKAGDEWQREELEPEAESDTE